MKFITLFLCLPFFISSAHAWRESHGGDSIAADFIGRTNDFVRLQKFQGKALADLAEIRENILVVTKNRVFDEKNNEIPVSTICQRQGAAKNLACTITINRLQYLALEKNHGENATAEKEALILEELLKIVAIANNAPFKEVPEKTTTTRYSTIPVQSNETTKEFINMTSSLLEDLSLIPEADIKVIYQKIVNAISTTGFISQEIVILNDVEKDAINTCLTSPATSKPCVIIISAPRWAQYDSEYTDQATRKKEQLIVHEFLSIIKENDKDYALSEKIVNRLNALRKEF